ncbi:MAG TPA: YbhB/YbcL family Raf kinase inhibitor-like protein [Bacteroidota bacterium]|nr:YbhB/YbcL family Raf kinase inhibitor-like protein [Bacteroidota bacterium]
MFTLSCTSYSDKGHIPTRYAHRSVSGGENISPGFTWNDPPGNTKSFALSIVDPHPVANNWVHWFIIDIPFRDRKLAEGASRTHSISSEAKELLNTYNELGYGGPAPPKGSGAHPYVATIYALNAASLALKKETLLTQFLRALEGKVIAQAQVTGYYEVK